MSCQPASRNQIDAALGSARAIPSGTPSYAFRACATPPPATAGPRGKLGQSTTPAQRSANERCHGPPHRTVAHDSDRTDAAQIVAAAAAAGFRYVGMRLAPARPGEPQHPMLGDTPMTWETLARLADTSVEVLDFDIFRLRRDTDVDAFLPVLDAGTRLGAAHLLVAVDDPDEARMVEVFGRACDAGAGFGLTRRIHALDRRQITGAGGAFHTPRRSAQRPAAQPRDPAHGTREDRPGGGARPPCDGGLADAARTTGRHRPGRLTGRR